jgi:Na+-driven multidrug efflux pump
VIYAVYVALALVAFLVVLNGFLRGAKKARIDAVLSLLLIGLIIIAFFVAGWKLGLLAIAIAFISAIVIRPIAARLASRLFAEKKSGDVGAKRNKKRHKTWHGVRRGVN